MTVGDARNAELAGLSVLVVEDDQAIGAQLVKGLTRVGCRTALVREATPALQNHGAGFVLLDLGLLGGRFSQLAYLAAIAFHVALLSFGWLLLLVNPLIGALGRFCVLNAP